MNKLKYLGYSVVFQEVPGEVTLAINISGCPHKCEGCHSKYLWEYDGNYLYDDLERLIKQYEGLITCVCFMGGDQNFEELSMAALIVKYHGLKTALYSGDSEINLNNNLAIGFDYIKIGPYNEKFGGLNSPTTNQRMYQYIDGVWKDITYKFWKEDKNNGKN